MLANAPKHGRAAYFETLRRSQGRVAANQLIEEVDAELAERRKCKAKVVEQAKQSIRDYMGGGGQNECAGNRSAGARRVMR